MQRGARSVRRRLWRVKNIAVVFRIAIIAILIGYSTPQLLMVFEHSDWAGVGAVFEASADCQIEFHLNSDMTALTDGSAEGSVVIGWIGDVSKCTKMTFAVPGPVRDVESILKNAPQSEPLKPQTIFRDGKPPAEGVSQSINGSITIDPRILNTEVGRSENREVVAGYLKITFDNFSDFIRPVSYTKSVTSLLARSYELEAPGESIEHYFHRPHRMPAPTLRMKMLLPSRFVVSETFVANPQATALDRGKSALNWTGSGMLYFDDLDHSEKKDLVVLIYGILLATGLAMLAELLCKFADYLVGGGEGG